MCIYWRHKNQSFQINFSKLEKMFDEMSKCEQQKCVIFDICSIQFHCVELVDIRSREYAHFVISSNMNF